MRKIIIVLMCLVAMGFGGGMPLLRAQITHASQGRLDENAAAVLKKAAARFDQNVSFDVTMTVLDSKKQTTAKQTAQVRYHKGKYRLVLPDQELFSDGTTVWHWNKAAKEVAVSNLVGDDIDLLNPGRLLATYGQHFKAKYIRTDPDGTAVVDLQPRSTQAYHKIRLMIAEADGLLKAMEVHKYDSSREIYEISHFKKTANAASQFVFDAKAHPEVEVIDMR